MLNESRPLRAPFAAKVVLAAAAIGGVFLASACSSDTSPKGSDGGSGGSTSTGGSSAGGKSSTGGSSTGGTTGKTDGGACTGKPATGSNDPNHCKSDGGSAIKQATGKCETEVADTGAPGPTGDAGAPDYGETLYGTEGDDDDCKYHVSYTVPPICQNDGVTFHVTVTTTVDGKPATGAYPYLETTLENQPSASAVPEKYKETSPGVYDVGPVVFDKPGKWVARFHFFENCSDAPEDSPHGHVAFYIQVP
jgi:hypothetical protein